MMIIVMYEMVFVKEVVDKVIFMVDGYIIEQGMLEELFDYLKNEWMKRFIKQVGEFVEFI